ncbi:hypothetical protein [Chondrinema litorale]|uniref:FEKKY domain-containing protein n=1 Tax=Chondrinema litorale TaxID=2994555 RepID=UPI00254361F3|nr:hypothetical protein [Chondrinema litorale]UZR97089.1 hypothetical protein OQ292_23605 [Chondrinema litorale]
MKEILTVFGLFFSLNIYSQDIKKETFTLKVIPVLDSLGDLKDVKRVLISSQETNEFLSYPFLYRQIDSTGHHYYTRNDLPAGKYYVFVNCLNYYGKSAKVEVGVDKPNTFHVKLERIPNPYSLADDIANNDLKLFANRGGSSAFIFDHNSKSYKKLKRKYKLSLVGSGGCITNNTNYDRLYNKKVIYYLDDKYGDK